jgi:GT2 family glycosyltransferase
LRHTIRSLRLQVYQRWSLHAVTDAKTSPFLVTAFRDQADREPRLSGTPMQLERPEPLTSRFDSNDFVALIDAGDSLPDYALAVVAETLARDRELELVYSDEDRITSDGDLTAPVLKPDWSPVLHQRVSYLGRLTLLKARLLTTQQLGRLLVDEEGAIDHLANELPRSAIRHVRRILYRRDGAKGGAMLPTTARTRRGADGALRWPEVTVVIPTRDRADLLAECLEGLKHKTDYRKFKTIVIDNGSTAPSAVRLLAEIAASPRVTVLRRPGPFNYSALSNDGARAAKSRVLVFLNNDIAMLDPGWLKAMVRWAVKPEIGVVGAKLLFPNGLIQHAGVVIGFGGVTGNIYRRLSKDHGDYLAKLTVPREVSAVTAACIAVERLKFEVVGGFDADNLPINLNDIDLCLRMIERGWTNIWTPEATLIHHQSATRGIDRDPFALDRKERAYFEPRWSEAIRDDPYFHPGLSLFCHDIALA